MASLQKKGDAWHCQFLYRGKRHTFGIGRVTEAEAESKASQVDYLLMRLKQGLIELPDGVGIVDFVRLDGKATPPAASASVQKATLGDLRDRFLATHAGALEGSTLNTTRTHFRHLVRTLGETAPLRELAQGDLQRHINARVKVPVSPVTARKEIATLCAAWNWGRKAGIVSGAYPGEGLVYPKTDEKPPFRTRAEIERQIARGGLSADRQAELWECLFLTIPEIGELLGDVRARECDPCAYTMFCLAAHTGMRRSEMMRARVEDIDFEGETILVREKKKQKGKRTIRRAPLSPFLAGVLKDWLASHPGGHALFLDPERGDPLTVKEAYGIFRRAVDGTKWEVLKGWHVLRHSFITGCVTAGVDQRLIDDWVGHTTEEMRRRYRHLVPSAQQRAIRSVFS